MTSYKMPIIITRGNNVYGPHQFPEKMIPKFTLLASRGKTLPLHGDGSAVRRRGATYMLHLLHRHPLHRHTRRVQTSTSSAGCDHLSCWRG